MRYTTRAAFGILAGALLLSLSLISTPAQAAQECQFQDKIRELKAIKAASGDDYLASIRKELSLRKEILKSAILCITNDAENLRGKLKAVSSDDPDIKSIRESLGAQLQTTIDFYQSEKAKIDTFGIRSSEESAKSIKIWRASTYAPLAEESVNFLLWVKNQEILKTAQTRFDQIRATVKALKINEREEMVKGMRDAEDNLEKANALHARAKDTFMSGGNPGTSLSLIKETLESLSGAYQNFFVISESATKILNQ